MLRALQGWMVGALTVADRRLIVKTAGRRATWRFPVDTAL